MEHRKLSKEEILSYQKDIPPYVFVDEIEDMVPGKYIIGMKHLPEDEWYFKCHFPGNPIVPGVLQLEMISQTGALLLLTLPKYEGREVHVSKANNVKWLKNVRPNTTLKIVVNLVSLRRGVGRITGKIYDVLTNDMVCKAEFVLVVSGEILCVDDSDIRRR